MSLTMLCCVLLASLAPAAVLTPAGFAQSAGDEQYVDPFQTEPESGGGGGNAGSGDGDPGAGSGTTEPQPSTPESPAVEPPADTSEVPVAPAGSDSSTGTEASASAGSALPRTGLPLVAVFGAGVLLVGGGYLLRRHA
jgi:hypothetical protein